MPHEVSYTNSEGEPGLLSGRPTSGGAPSPELSWVDKIHPDVRLLHEDERRQRASYVATRRALARFLVPHRFEGGEHVQDPAKLLRARLGYGVRLNANYLGDITGHLRGTGATYSWGPLAGTAEADPRTDPPTEGLGSELWSDATRDGLGWRQFVEGQVLEWLLSSPGGFVLVDNDPEEAAADDDAGGERSRTDRRPFVRLVPWSWVEDREYGPAGLRFIRLLELVSERGPKDAPGAKTKQHVVYELLDGGDTEVSRYDKDGEPIGPPVNLGRFEDGSGRAILPLQEVRFGEHPEVEHAGLGLLAGLDDIVIDLYNLLSETREGFRDASFSLNTYRGPSYADVLDAFKKGSRLIPLGNEPHTELQRIAADGGEVSAGISLIELTLKAWAQAAKRKAADAMERAEARSGVSLKSEFQLDLKPLLTEVAETLDEIETNVLWIIGQMAGERPEALADVGVSRETEFNLEPEDSRIARKVREFLDTGLQLPPELVVRLTMSWIERTGLLDLEEEVDVGGGGRATLRERVETEVREMAETGRRAGIQEAGLPPVRDIFAGL